MTATAPARPSKPRIAYPRPPLVRDHRDLFREAVYRDGQPYSDGLDDEDDEPGEW